MNKLIVIIIFVVLILYTFISTFIIIPNAINVLFYGLCTIGALIILFFHFDITKEIKSRMNSSDKPKNDLPGFGFSKNKNNKVKN